MSTTLATPCTAAEFEKMRLIYVASYISYEMWFGAHKNKNGTWGYTDVGLECPVCVCVCVFFKKHTKMPKNKQAKKKGTKKNKKKT